MWAAYCKEYTNEQNYLYASYTRDHRTQKVKIMIEKCALLMVTLYATSASTREFKPMFGFLVVFLFLVSLVIQRPFNDVYEDVMDIFCRFTNSFTAFVGIIAEKYYSVDRDDNIEGALGTSLGIVNGICILVLVFGFLALPFRIFFSKRAARKEAARLQKELWGEEDEGAVHRQQTHKVGDRRSLDVQIGLNALIEDDEEEANEGEENGSPLPLGNEARSELAQKAEHREKDEGVENAAAYDTSGGKLGVLVKLKTASAKKFAGWDPSMAGDVEEGGAKNT